MSSHEFVNRHFPGSRQILDHPIQPRRSSVDPRFLTQDRLNHLLNHFSVLICNIGENLGKGITPSEDEVAELKKICWDPDFSFTAIINNSSQNPISLLIDLSTVEPEEVRGQIMLPRASADSVAGIIIRNFDTLEENPNNENEVVARTIQEIDSLLVNPNLAYEYATFCSDLTIQLLEIAQRRKVDFSQPLYVERCAKCGLILQENNLSDVILTFPLYNTNNLKVCDWLAEHGASYGYNTHGKPASITLTKYYNRLSQNWIEYDEQGEVKNIFSEEIQKKLKKEIIELFLTLLNAGEELIIEGDCVALAVCESSRLPESLVLELLHIADQHGYCFQRARNFSGENLLCTALKNAAGYLAPPVSIIEFILKKGVNPRESLKPRSLTPYYGIAVQEFVNILSVIAYNGQEILGSSRQKSAQEFLKEICEEVGEITENPEDRINAQRLKNIRALFSNFVSE